MERNLMIPTYYPNTCVIDPDSLVRDEFGPPWHPVSVTLSNGVRLVLGCGRDDDSRDPDILVERRRNGWAIFLHPLGGSDPSGCVYFLDDGRSFIVPEVGLGPTFSIDLRLFDVNVPNLDALDFIATHA